MAWSADNAGWGNTGQSRRQELRRRDQIRQAYYESLKNPEVVEEVEEPEIVIAPKYFTQAATKGWFDVIGSEGKVNQRKLRLKDAEQLALELNNDING